MARLFSNLSSLKPRRKALRNALTPAEAYLWSALKGSQLAGRKFRRQHSIQNFVLDFFCPSEALAVELDGAAHDSEQAERRDQARDMLLQELGIRVARYENQDVLRNIDGVLAHIRAQFKR